MSDQNNTSFAHAFLPGLILGLIVGAVAGAFVPDMMTAKRLQIDPSHAPHVDQHTRDGQLIDDAEDEAQRLIDEAQEQLDEAEDEAKDLIDDAKNTLPSSP